MARALPPPLFGPMLCASKGIIRDLFLEDDSSSLYYVYVIYKPAFCFLSNLFFRFSGWKIQHFRLYNTASNLG